MAFSGLRFPPTIKGIEIYFNYMPIQIMRWNGYIDPFGQGLAAGRYGTKYINK